MASTMKIPTEFTAVDKFTSVVNGMSGSINKFTKNAKNSVEELNRTLDKTSRNLGIAGGAIVGFGVLAYKGAQEFEKSMGNVGTLIDTNKEDLGKMGDDVLKLANTMPKPIDELTTSLYSIRSAGIDASNALGVLESSGKLAVAGLGTTEEATDLMTSAINAFASEGLTSNQIADKLFKTVKAGKTDVSALSQAFGSTAPIIQSAGVKLDDFLAATAAITTVGTPAAQAQTQIRAAIVSMQKPSAEMVKIYKRLGVATEKELIAKEGGIVGAFQAINSEGGKMGINMAKAWSSVEAGAAVTSLTGATNQAYVNTLKDMTVGADAIGDAFEKQMGTSAAQAQIAENNIQSLRITIGQALIPVINSFIQLLTPLLSGLKDWAKDNDGLIKTIFIAGGVMLGLAGAIKIFQGIMWATRAAIFAYNIVLGVLNSLGIINTGITATNTVALTAWNIAATAAEFITGIWTAAQWLLNIALTANPIGLIIIAIAALIAIIIVIVTKTKGWGDAWNHIVSGMKLGFMAFVEGIKLYYSTMINALMIGFEYLKKGWYKFKLSMGLGNRSENYIMLKQIDETIKSREKAIVDGAKKVADLAKQSGEEFRKAGESVQWKTEAEMYNQEVPQATQSPEEMQSKMMYENRLNGNIGINVNDRGNTISSVEPSDFNGMPVSITNTQGAF